MVTPSMTSPNFTVPGTSVRIGTEKGSHSDSSWPCFDLVAFAEEQLGAVGQAVALPLATGLVLDDDLAVAIHHDVVLLALDQLDVLELHHAVVARLEL